MKNILLFLGVILVFSSCGENTFKNEVNPKILGKINDPQVVVLGVISPSDTLIKIQITRTIPVLSQGPKEKNYYLGEKGDTLLYYSDFNTNWDPIENASVTISDGEIKKGFWYDKVKSSYFAKNDGFLKAGKTYKLIINADNKNLESECTIPSYTAKIDSITVDSTNEGEFDDTYYARYYGRTVWTDDPDQVNYYYVNMNMVRIIYIENVNQEYLSTEQFYPENGSNIYLDLIKTGNRIETSIYASNTLDISQNNIYPLKLVQARVYTIDENFFAYLRSIDNQNQTSGNPLVEPVPIYSNVKGGIGCFAGVNSSSLELEL